MSKTGKNWRAAQKVVEENRLAIMNTADEHGHAHGAWMNVLVDSEMTEVNSITSPHTQKIANLSVNPYAEWMISSHSMEKIVYLSGPTVIVAAEEARSFWDRMPDKSKAYYQHYSDIDDPEGFTVIRTRVCRIEYCRPKSYQKELVHEMPLAE